MLDFYCQCGNSIFFNNTRCLRCERRLGFLPEARRLTSLEPLGDGRWQVPPAGSVLGRIYRLCTNYSDHNVCNWLVPEESPHCLCPSCRLTRTIPDLTEPRHHALWAKLEASKRHLVYNLMQLGLPIIGRDQDPDNGLAFDFLADRDANTEFTERLAGQAQINTGHANGLITINIAEADDVARARMREQMGEHYRTLLGHFRHEIGHYYWARLIDNTPRIDEYRALFGDERADYGAALQQHYSQGAPADWQAHFVTPYASSHPWEDWAESWAHYLHIRDTLETATEYQLVAAPPWQRDSSDFDALSHRWTHLAIGMNAVNRSMGLPDAYPFVLPARAYEKLGFIHRVVDGYENPAR
ncbi:zinc-binding metallopeptidase family protein [Salinisphaera aquimarina]|uniref:Zinc-binding metallopeptidase n=1 Tax=Salinisphaera aquimarina TaxID=2094031 RepID=A0ABV7EJ48_9GAMM